MRAHKHSVLRVFTLVCLAGLVQGDLLRAASATWTPTGSLAEARSGSAAVLLSDGRILFTGGTGSSGPLATTEFFNTNGSFAPGAPMQEARSGHTAVLLKDGRVLVAGGTTLNGITNTAELWNASGNSWTPVAGGMTIARTGHTASLLSDGRVLIAGGQSTSGATNILEIFSPATGGFDTVSGTLSSPRQQHAAAVLQDGTVLILGGSDGTNSLATADVFDPANDSISAAPNMSTPRANLSATTLLDGNVLVAGGNNGTADLASAEIYNSGGGTFSATGSLATARSSHLAFLLPNNNEVLIVGGTSAGAPLSSAELFVPWNGSFTGTGGMATARTAAAGSPLNQNGRLLVAGGSNGTNPLAAGELYSFATVTTDQPDYAVGTTVNVSGSGWQPGETVTLILVESPLIDTHGPYTAVADSNGNISNSQFVTDLHDINIRFYLTAKGSVSQAQTTFFDAAAATVTFATDSPCAATGTASGTNNGGNPFTNTAFTTGKPSASFGTQPSTGVTYTYAPTVTCGAATYTFVSASPTSPFTSGAANSTTTVTAHYVLTSVTTKLVLSAPSPASVTFGSTGLVALSATLTRNDTNAGVANATVTFTIDGTTVGTGTTIASGVASFSYNPSALTAGSHTVQATFANQIITSITFLASTSGTQALTVGAPTTLTLSAPNPASVTLGSAGPVALSATLVRNDTHAPVSGATVTFKVDNTSVVPTGTTNSSGVASISYNPSALTAGPHTVLASFAGQTISAVTYLASTSGPQTLTVNNSATTTQVVSSLNPSSFGQAVSFTATVTSASGTPTGSVTFYDGGSCAIPGTVLASAVSLNAGVAGFSTSTLAATSHTILACYSPTGTFTASSGTVSQQVGKTTPVITWANPADIPYGTALSTTQLNAIANAAGAFVYTPAAGTVLGVGSGQALSVLFTPTDTADYTTATKSVQINVLLATPVVTGSGPGTSTYGQAVTLSVTVAPSSGGTPTGTVTFSFTQNSTTYYVCADGSVTPATPACSVPVSTTPNSSGAYVASVTTNHLPPGTDGVTATYSGDGNFQGEPATVSVTVSQADTATTLTKSPDPSNYGDAVALTVAVKDNTANSTGVPTGTVTLSFKLHPTDPTPYNVCADGTVGTTACASQNQITLAADSTDTTGVTATATVNTSKLPVGLSTAQFAYSLNASYSGDTNFKPSGPFGLSQTVNQRPITVTAATDTKPYDGNTSSSGKPTITTGTLVTGDTANFTQTFDNRNAGTGKTLTPTGSVNDGFSGNNYNITFTQVNTGVINALPITVTAVADKKTYDGTTSSTKSPTIAPDLISPDKSGFTQAFSTKNVGTNLTLTPSGTVNDGNGGNNYNVNFANTNTGEIDVAPLTITALTNSKTYDGTTSAAAVPTVAGLQGTDTVTGLSETYDTPTASLLPNKTLSVATYTVNDGNGGHNYLVTPVTNTTGVIIPAPLTLTASSFSRYYGLPNPPLTGTYLGFVNGEGPTVLGGTLSCTTLATVASDVGMYRIDCGGQTSTNYAITPVPGTLTITAAPTSTVLTSAVTGSSGAAKVTLTATVTSTIVPLGTVTFVDVSNNNANLGNAPVGTSGQASIGSLTSLSVGTHLISATYAPPAGNADFLGSSAQDPNTTLAAIITAPSANNDVFAVNTSVPLSATFTATNTASPSAVWTLTNTATNASLTPVAGTISAANITGSTTFAGADVYAFTLSFTDGVGGIVIANTVAGLPATIVIYDPSAGFVTGGGWINSPVGAYTPDKTLTGKATFGFVSKYQKGANVPTGNTEFQFQVANFNFHSTSYQWMVVSGSLAQYKGGGTINGSGNYNFLLTALDGSLAGGGTLDGLRMKITDPATNTVVYDNLVSSDDSMQAKNTEALGDKGVGGGSIIIHSK